jgi:signal peptidase I
MTDRQGDPPPGDGDIDIRIAPVDDEFVSRPRPVRPAIQLPRPLSERPAVEPPAEPRAEKEPSFEAVDVPAETSVDDADSPDDHVVDPRSGFRLYFEAMLVTLVIWLFAQTFLAQPVTVPTGSMLNTILIGDHLVVNRVIFGTPDWLAPLLPYRAIRRGDIVVFRHPTDPETLYVKRVIALPGETLEVYGTRVYVNSRELPENKVGSSDPGDDRPLVPAGPAVESEGATYTVFYSSLRDVGAEDELGSLASADGGLVGVGRPFTVPDGQYFVMGDNRDNSQDSRFWGTVPRANVVGRAMFVYWSYGTDESADGPNPSRRPRLGRIGTLLQ